MTSHGIVACLDALNSEVMLLMFVFGVACFWIKGKCKIIMYIVFFEQEVKKLLLIFKCWMHGISLE